MANRIIGVTLILAALPALAGCVNLGPLVGAELEAVLVERSPRWIEPNRIALVDVEGFIGSGMAPRLFWRGAGVADVKEKLDRAAADRRVRAVVLRINSPGGEVTACDMIYEEVLRFKRESGKPVVASLMGAATSGGYYVALAADRIVAAPTTVTGSVGVVMEFVNVEGLFGKVGLRPEVIKSGDKQDIGSPMRAMTDEEREILQGVNLALFDRFAAAVRENRPQMTDEDAALISDGRILTADQALDLHMVDRVGYLDDALSEARALANIGSADVILYSPYRHYNTNIYARAGLGAGLIEEGLERLLERRGPMFLYLWSPGR